MATIVKGSDRKLKLIFKTKTEEPLDLTNCTEIKATFVDDNSEKVSLLLSEEKISILSKAGGIVEVKLPRDFTAMLKTGERQDFQIDFTINDERIVHLFEQQLTVKDNMVA